MKNIPAVTAFTRQGRALVQALRWALRPVHWAKGNVWASPPQLFHEDPRHFTTRDLIFFAYKYYLNPPVKDDADGTVIDFFKQNPPLFKKNTIENTVLNTVTITAAGDLMPYEWIQKKYCAHLWDDIADDFFSSDITFANLETPIDVSKPASLVPEVMLSDMLFNADEEMFDIFNGGGNTRGFDILSTANNHSLDMGEQGVYSTIEFLNKKSIQHVGTASSAETRVNFPIIERNDIKIAFIAYTFSLNKFVNPNGKEWLVNHLEVNQVGVDLSAIKNDVKHARERGADFVILSLHYGNAYQAFPGQHIVENTKRIFEECGVDIILGGHPHNIQPMARYDFICPFTQVKKQGFVLFSFSDFVAYDIFNWGHLSVYLKLSVSKCLTTEGVVQTLLTHVDPVPVYANGVFKNKNTRDLRFLDAQKALKAIKSGKTPTCMTAWNVRELRSLMHFYDYVMFNLK